MKRLLKQNEFHLAALILVLCIGITIVNPSFLTLENVLGFLKTSSVNGILAVGVLFVLILGGTPDVSFTAIAQVVEYVVVLATLRWGGNVALALLGARNASDQVVVREPNGFEPTQVRLPFRVIFYRAGLRRACGAQRFRTVFVGLAEAP